MLAKLAFRNTRRSFGDFAVYFLTLTFGVAAFYAFGSVEAQSAMTVLGAMKPENLKTMSGTMDVMSIVVSIVLAFLVVYANGFLIKRRKREFGTYLMLGMPKRQVAVILLMETVLVGLLALGAGLALGVVASQGLALMTAQLFELDMSRFSFVFSGASLVKTVGLFGLLFAVVGSLNLLGFSRQSVSRLLNASKRSEMRLRNPIVSALLAIAGLALALGGCWAVVDVGLVKLLDGPQIWIAVGAGIVGTFLLFAGGSGLALRIAQLGKRTYLRGLNPFVIRQLDSKVSSTYATMAIVCITMFFAITILSGGISFGNVLNKRTSKAYDASFIRFGNEAQKKSIARGISDNGFDTHKYFAKSHEFALYDSPIVLGELTGDRADKKRMGDSLLQMIAVSDANALLLLQGKPELELGTDGFAVLFTEYRSEYQAIRDRYADARPSISGNTLRAVSGGLQDVPVDAGGTLMPVLVVPDRLVAGATVWSTTLNVIYAGDGDAVEKAVIAAGLVDSGHDEPGRPFDTSSTSRAVNAETITTRVVVTYIGLYIGLILLIASVAILALQQLSEATDNKARYATLSKIGASDKLMSKAVFTQVAVYFAAPLGVALVYSLFGGRAILDVIKLFGQVDVANEYGLATVILILVFGGYFIATAIAARRIALEK
jgi:putative ABC transport system permease protein